LQGITSIEEKYLKARRDCGSLGPKSLHFAFLSGFRIGLHIIYYVTLIILSFLRNGKRIAFSVSARKTSTNKRLCAKLCS
jgi:hypothetical protein